MRDGRTSATRRPTIASDRRQCDRSCGPLCSRNGSVPSSIAEGDSRLETACPLVTLDNRADVLTFVLICALITLLDGSFGGLGMANHGIHEPDGSSVVVDAIREPAASSDFVLPLLHALARHVTSTEIATEGMLTFGTGAGIFSQLLPRSPLPDRPRQPTVGGASPKTAEHAPPQWHAIPARPARVARRYPSRPTQ